MKEQVSPNTWSSKTLHCNHTCSVYTHSAQPPVVVLISSGVFPRSHQPVVHAGDVAADAGHLGGGVDRTLLSLRLQLYCLTQRKPTKSLRAQTYKHAAKVKTKECESCVMSFQPAGSRDFVLFDSAAEMGSNALL